MEFILIDGMYSPYLVVLSLVVAMLASYTTLDLVQRICSLELAGKKKQYWLLGGAVAMGVGIWSMHFIGMLAFQMPMKIGYDPWITSLSLFIAVVISYLALYITTRNELSRMGLFAGGIIMGIGIAAMHYVGMEAMRMRPRIHYQLGLFMASLGIALLASWAALWIAFKLQKNQRHLLRKRCVAAIVMGIAIAGMHYVGMSAAMLPVGSVCDAVNGVSSTTLVMVVSIFSLFGLLMALLLSMLDTRFDSMLTRSNNSIEDVNHRLHILATVDTLTGIPNRSSFMEKTEQRILQSQRDGSTFSLMFMDLDGFKTINDSLGHGAGDQLLKLFSKELQSRVRTGDVVGRLGGDEFVVLFDKHSNEKDVTPVAAAILDRMQKDFPVNGVPLRITVSVGIATYPQDGDSVSVLLRNADIAMYDAKQHGRNTYRFFNASMSDTAARMLKISQGLTEALSKGQFSLAFQPKFGGIQNKMLGAEALIRWTHPEFGNIPPMDFIPIAEQTGQITQISEWVIAEVCHQMNHWERIGIPRIKVAINLSPEQLRQEGYAERIAKMVSSASIEPKWVMFEITETIAMQEPEMTAQVIHEFQRAGFDIAIDDFGTGYSSMAYLQQFRVKELKIDRFFTNALDSEGEESGAIVSAIIALAHSLQMTVVAEGVETMSQLNKLHSMDCDQMQGFLLAKPLASGDFEKFLREQARKEEELYSTGLRKDILRRATLRAATV